MGSAFDSTRIYQKAGEFPPFDCASAITTRNILSTLRHSTDPLVQGLSAYLAAAFEENISVIDPVCLVLARRTGPILMAVRGNLPEQ